MTVATNPVIPRFATRAHEWLRRISQWVALRVWGPVSHRGLVAIQREVFILGRTLPRRVLRHERSLAHFGIALVAWTHQERVPRIERSQVVQITAELSFLCGDVSVAMPGYEDWGKERELKTYRLPFAAVGEDSLGSRR